MIRLWQADESLPQLETGWAATYVLSRAEAYGTGARFAPFYGDEKGNLLSILDGHAVFVGDNADMEEWAAFIQMRPDLLSVTAEVKAATALASLSGRQITVRPVMRLQTPPPAPTRSLTEASPRDLYPLLSAVFGAEIPPFEDWYVDISHRTRHGLCHIAAIRQGSMLVSAAMTVAECVHTAILGGVATLPDFRRQGMARQCVCGLISDILAENDRKTILISPKNPQAERLYRSLRFVTETEIGRIQ